MLKLVFVIEMRKRLLLNMAQFLIFMLVCIIVLLPPLLWFTSA